MRQQHASLLSENDVQFWQHVRLYRLMRTLYVLIFFNSINIATNVSTETFGRASIISTKALTVLDFIGIPAMARMDRSSATTCHLSSSGCTSICCSVANLCESLILFERSGDVGGVGVADFGQFWTSEFTKKRQQNDE